MLHNSPCRFVLRCSYRTHHCTLYESLNWLTPKDRRFFHWSLFTFKWIHFNFTFILKTISNSLQYTIQLKTGMSKVQPGSKLRPVFKFPPARSLCHKISNMHPASMVDRSIIHVQKKYILHFNRRWPSRGVAAL